MTRRVLDHYKDQARIAELEAERDQLRSELAALKAVPEGVEVVAVVTTAHKNGIGEQRSLWHGEDGADQWVSHMQGRGCETSKTLLMTVAQHNAIVASLSAHKPGGGK